jgi:hypothetical protein
VRVPFEQHELLGMIHRQFLEHDSVNEAEDRRVRANSQRQRQHSNRGESRLLRQHPEPVPRVLPERVHN